MTEKNSPKVLVLGATSAIAIATMRIYAGRGSSFYLAARNQDKLDAVASDLRVRGASAVSAAAIDLDDTSRHATMLKNAVSELGGIDVVLLAYGVLGDQAVSQETYFEAEKVFRTNLMSAISLLTWLGNYFAERKSGTIAVISSVAGDRGRQSNYVYGASKAGLSTFVQGLRNRMHVYGVNVLTVKPGFVATPMTAHLKQGALFASPERVAQGIVHGIDRRKDEIYVPGFWRPIMGVIRLVPERVFKKLKL